MLKHPGDWIKNFYPDQRKYFEEFLNDSYLYILISAR